MAAQYEYPVHYQDKDGDWVDYDNRMEEAETQPVTEEVTDAPTQAVTVTNLATEAVSVTEQNTASATDASEVTNGANARSVQEETTATEAPTHATQAVQPQSDVSELSEDNTEFANKKSDIDIRLANKAKKNNMVKIKTDGYQASWGFTDINKSKIQFVENKEKLSGNDKFTVQKNLVSEALYKDVFAGVDMQYLVTPVGVKENIILKNKDARKSFEIEYKSKGLTAVQKNSYTIELKNKNGKVVYEISAPFMTDAIGERSTQLNLTIKNQKNNKLTVLLCADKDWIKAAKRVYPVTIDPNFTYGQEWGTISSTFVDESSPNNDNSGLNLLQIGSADNSVKKSTYRSYVKINALPNLNPGDMIVEAYLTMERYKNNGEISEDLYIGAYQVASPWIASATTWNTANSIQIDSNVVDYATVKIGLTREGSSTWNLTKCVKSWYSGTTNNGIMLAALPNSNKDSTLRYYSSNISSNPNMRPAFELIYRNNKGIENYWTYTSFNVGTAGTAYINDYTGNLVFIHRDFSTPGEKAPATIEHIYNNYVANNTTSKDLPIAGNGWRLSVQKSVFPSDLFGLSLEDQRNYPFVYTDGDGTEHYFVKESSTTYKDEDGLGYTLYFQQGSSTARYIIQDPKGNEMHFDFSGVMTSQKDTNGNKILVNYASDNRNINSVIDGAGKELVLTSSSNLVRSIKDTAGRLKKYKYSTTNQLTQITLPDANVIRFTYDNENSLTSVQDVDGYKVEFIYASTGGGKQVVGVQEYGANGSLGQKITFDRSLSNETLVRMGGTDGTFGNNDDLFLTKQFDNYGRTTYVKSSTQNAELAVEAYDYTDGQINETADNIRQINRISNQYSQGSNVVNMLPNHNMEQSASWVSAAWEGTPTFTSSYSIEDKYMGNRSMKINVTASSGTSSGRIYQDINNTVLAPGKTYTLSGYVKTANIATTAKKTGAVLAVTSFDSNNVSTTYYSDYITGNTESKINSGWKRLNLTFTVPANSEKTRINLALRGTNGTAYFDALQLEENELPNAYNVIENSGMERAGTNGLPEGWTAENLTSGSDTLSSNESKSGTASFKITGDPKKDKNLIQSVNINGTKNDTYILSGWAKANSVHNAALLNKDFQIAARVYYNSGDPVWKSSAIFNESVSEWQYASTAFTLDDGTAVNRTPVKIEIYLQYHKQANAAYFDNIQLKKDIVNSITYNADGQPVSIQKNAEQKSKMEYSNENLTKSVDAKGFAFTYDYDNKHNMVKSTSQNGITTNYVYNSAGLPTAIEAKNSDNDASLMATQEYSSDGAFVTKTTDQLGNAVLYNYDPTTGTLKNASDSTGTVSYTYSSTNDKVQNVSKYIADEDTTVKNSFNYTIGSNRNLTQVSHNSMSYFFGYDTFNNLTQIKAGDKVLESYTYGANNSAVNKVTYGNGDFVNYSYDDFGNIKSQSINGNVAYKWFSNALGVPTRLKDMINETQYDDEYDVTGRIVRRNAMNMTQQTNIFSLEYGYDENNNLTKLINVTSDKTARNYYSFGKDNLLEKYTIDDSRNVLYKYDSLNRLNKISIDTTTPVNMEYKYWTAAKRNEGRTDNKYKTTRISEETIGNEQLAYYYDDQGKITEIKKMINGTYSSKQYFEYDEMGQLIYDMNYENSILKQYVYDNGGNITAEYTSTMLNGRPVSTTTKNYTYGDMKWTDKMTAYGDQNIIYDDIGNPLTYRDEMSMTWKNGRQLATLQKGSTKISYTYSADDTRATKTINGVKHTYQYVEGKLVHETRGDKIFNYYYDSNGKLTAIKYRLTSGGTEYSYFVTHNWRGDIVGIYSGSGVLTARYEYDTWGNVLSVKNASGADITDPNNVGNLNPFRYRGYYLDTETGMYYLLSRYFDPVTHRFVSSDKIPENGNGLLWINAFTYCINDPVNMIDSNGKFPVIIATLVIILIPIIVKVMATVGSNIYCDSKNYPVSKTLFDHAIWGFGQPLSQDDKDLLIGALMHSSKLKSEILKKLNEHNNSYVLQTGGLVVFDKDDLYFGIHEAVFAVGGFRKNGKWYLHVMVRDNFDFTQYWGPDQASEFARLANNMGVLMADLKLLFGFKWEVFYDTIIY